MGPRTQGSFGGAALGGAVQTREIRLRFAVFQKVLEVMAGWEGRGLKRREWKGP